MAGGRLRGGILGLLDLIGEHRAALRYDWRARFGVGLDESVPERIGWDEAIDLVRVIRSDPSSQTAAAIEGWDYPLDRVGWVLAHMSDVLEAAHLKKPTGYNPRPVKAQDKSRQRWGNTGGRTRAEIVAILNAHGHSLSA